MYWCRARAATLRRVSRGLAACRRLPWRSCLAPNAALWRGATTSCTRPTAPHSQEEMGKHTHSLIPTHTHALIHTHTHTHTLTLTHTEQQQQQQQQQQQRATHGKQTPPAAHRELPLRLQAIRQWHRHHSHSGMNNTASKHKALQRHPPALASIHTLTTANSVDNTGFSQQLQICQRDTFTPTRNGM